MAPCVHLEWTPIGGKNVRQGPSCGLAHRAGVISCEAPLLVVSRGGKYVVGGAKKEGQGEGFHSHQGRPWQFPGLPVHPCALLGLASSSGHSLLFLDYLEFCDDYVAMAPIISSYYKPLLTYTTHNFFSLSMRFWCVFLCCLLYIWGKYTWNSLPTPIACSWCKTDMLSKLNFVNHKTENTKFVHHRPFCLIDYYMFLEPEENGIGLQWALIQDFFNYIFGFWWHATSVICCMLLKRKWHHLVL